MTLSLALDKLHRYLNRHWSAEKGQLSYNEYDYLKTVEAAEQYDPDIHVDQHADHQGGRDAETIGAHHGHGAHLSALAADMQVQKASASVMVKKLEKVGWIERTPCRYDSRAQHILLTKAGRALLQEEAGRYDQIAAVLNRALTKAECQNLEQLLEKVGRAL